MAVTCHARLVRVLAILPFAAGLAAQAAEQRYDYDPLGRLVRSVEGGQANEYVYDPAGNLLQVTGGAVQPPVITTGDLGDFRRNEFRQVSVSGTSLTGATIRPSHSGLRIDNVVASATAISFRVAVEPDTPLGAHQLAFETAAGLASAGLNVVPGLVVTFEPLPIAVPPDNQARKYTVRLSEPAIQSQTFSLSTYAPSIAKTKTAAVSFLTGQTTADFGVIGVAAGTTILRLSSASLVESEETIVTVSTGAGSQLVYSRPLGITRGVPWSIQNDKPTHTFSKSVGVMRYVPWAYTSDFITPSMPVGIVRGVPWSLPADAETFSKSVGIVRGVPFALPAENMVVSPLVGVTRP